MQENTTFRKYRLLYAVLSIFTIISFSKPVSAQTFCANETVFFTENFGTGIGTTTSPDVVNLVHSPLTPGVSLNDGYYRIINNTQQRNEWHVAPDHTANDVDGKMLVINGVAETFYSKIITNGVTGFNPGTYGASLYLMNTNPPGVCAPNPLLPSITFRVEYSVAATGDTWIGLQNVTSNSVPQTANPTWLQLGGVFNLPVSAQRFRLLLSDGTVSGCGNDFAIDDILFATCPSGGPLPVEFLGITASQKGSGVAVNWSTAAEFNNKYFDVEKSTDGGNWNTIARVNGAGTSNTVLKYNAYDAKPAAGYNYYRIKQIDIDGKFDYSDVVKVKITIEKTGVSVLTNPFVNNITVDFLSNTNQSVNVKLTDISGKLIAADKWQISKGNTRVNFDKVAGLQRGMYILTVTDMNGEMLYNNKLIKQ